MTPIRLRGLALVIFSLFWLVDHTLAQGTAFTYQGRLNDTSGPASGTYDLQFNLYLTNTDGQAIAGPITNSAIVVSNGLFLSAIDFGTAFNGTNCWLDVAVRTNGAALFTELIPRQPVTPAPSALFAVSAGTITGNIPMTRLDTNQLLALTAAQTALTIATSSIPAQNITGIVTNLPGNSSWTLAGVNLLLNSTNYSTEPSTNITITGAGVTLANDIYFGFDPQMTNFSNQNVALSANGLFGIFGPGMNINGYPFEIDDTLFGTNYYYSTNGVVWYSASSVFNPPPMVTVNFAGLLTNYTLLKVSIPGLRYNSIWNFGAKGGDNDDTAAFQAAAESGQIVSLDPSTNYTISNLTLPAGAHIEGQGAVVKVKSTMVGYAVTFNSAVNFINQPATVFHNVILDGGSYYPAWSFSGSNVISGANNVWRSGFYIGANLPNTDFSGCVAMNFQDRGFTFVGNFSAYPQPATGSTIANNIQAYNCWVGAEFVNSAEYFVGNGWQIKNCGHAIHIFSGNDQLTGLNCTRNGIAVYITGAGYIDPNGVSKDNYSVANAAHGVVSGCLNHNGYAAWLSEFNQGFAFNNCTMQGGNVLNNIVMMTNVTGVTIYGGQPGTSQIIVNGTDANSGDNYYNWQGLSNYPSVYAYGTGKLHLISGLISELNGVFFTNGVALGAFAGNGSSLTNLNGPGIIGGAITNAICTPGNVTAAQIASTNGYFIATSGTITNPIAGGGLLWNSNNALYWITSTHTNYITGP